MRVVIVGGSGFLGKNVVRTALKLGHTVSSVQRNSIHLNDVEEILVDITDTEKLKEMVEGRKWECVIDMAPITNPSIVRNVSQIFKDCGISFYIFISSLAVYKDFSQSLTENSSLTELIEDKELSGSTFGGLKVGCEQAVNEEIGMKNVCIIRPGLIIGPEDKSGRFAYWIKRFTSNDEDPVAVPVSPSYKFQAIDVRDLAEWIISLLECKNPAGIFNTVNSYYFGDLVEGCQQLCSQKKKVKWISNSILEEEKIKPFTELPCWVSSAMAGFSDTDCSKASQLGLSSRSIENTVHDTATWLHEIGDDAHQKLITAFWKPIGSKITPGLSREVENTLIAKC